MRYVGLLFIVAAGIGAGIHYGRRLHRRARFLQRTTRLMRTMEQHMSYAARPLATMWRGFAADEMFGDFSLVTETVALLGSMPFAAAVQTAVRGLATSEGLTAADCGLICEFASGCGVTGIDEQREHLRTYARLCAQQSEEAAEEATARTPVCRVMGLAAGVGTALLFLEGGVHTRWMWI